MTFVHRPRLFIDTLKAIKDSSPEQRTAAAVALTTHADTLTDKQRLFVHALLPRVERAAPDLAAQLRPVTMTPTRTPDVTPPTPAPEQPPTAPAVSPAPELQPATPPASTTPAAAREPQPEPFTPSPPVFRFPDARPHPLLDEQITLLASSNLRDSLDAARFLHTYRHDLTPTQHRQLLDQVATWSTPRAFAPEEVPLDRQRAALTRQTLALAPQTLAAPARLDLALAVRTIATPEAATKDLKQAIRTVHRQRQHVTAEQRQLMHAAPKRQQDPRIQQALYTLLDRTRPPGDQTPRPRQTTKQHLDRALATLAHYPHPVPDRNRHAITALTTLGHKLSPAQQKVLRSCLPALEKHHPRLAHRLASIARPRAQLRPAPSPLRPRRDIGPRTR